MVEVAVLFLLPLAQTDEEYRDGYLCTVDATTLTRSITFYSWIRNEVVQELDWREKGVVSAVKSLYHETPPYYLY